MDGHCEYAIVGGGVAGLAMAIALTSVGKDFLLFERSPVLRGIGAGFGLAANAMKAFEELGMREEVEEIGFCTETYRILDERGNVLVSPDARRLGTQYDQKNFTVHRADLHRLLSSKIEVERLRLGKRLADFWQNDGYVVLVFEDGTEYRCRYLIAADGVNSLVRQKLFPNTAPRYAGYTCWRATIDNVVGLKHGSETWGAKGRFGMTPLVGNRIYWYACVNSVANNHLYKRFTVEDLVRQFGRYHYPIPSILESTKDEDLIWNDIVDIRPLRHLALRNIVLIGDAGHATTPNLGQGACQALEDVVVLLHEIRKGIPIQAAFISFERRRLNRTKYIIDTSWQIGKVAQWTNPFLIHVRNNFLRAMPAIWSQASLRKLLTTDFMKINAK